MREHGLVVRAKMHIHEHPSNSWVCFVRKADEAFPVRLGDTINTIHKLRANKTLLVGCKIKLYLPQ